MPTAQSDPIKYQHGTPIHFITTRNFTLGNTINGQPLALTKGTDVFFDGTTADVAGSRYPLPQLRGAIRTGWLVLAQRYDENDFYYGMLDPRHVVEAGIQVRHAADGGNPLKPNVARFDRATSEDVDEREVGNVDDHARNTRSLNSQPTNRYRASQRPRDPEVEPGRRFTGSVWQVEPQDGVEVRRGFATSDSTGEDARSIRPTQLNRAGEAISRANSVQIQPGEGHTEEEMLERMHPDDRELYLQDKEMYRSRYADVAPAPRAIRADPSANRVVGRVANHGVETREGMSSRVTTGGGTEAFDLSGLDTSPARHGVVAQEGLNFRTTNGPERDLRTTAIPFQQETLEQAPQVVRSVNPAVTIREAPAEIRKMVAKQVCADFPDNYDFNGSPRKRLARLQADYEDRTDVLRAVFAAEGDEMKGLLLTEFPHAFQQ